jgi:hypothetical protein
VVAANERSLSKLSCLQRISIGCQKCVFCSESVIRCRNWAISSELAFATESMLSTVNLWFAAKIELSAVNYLSLLKLYWL